MAPEDELPWHLMQGGGCATTSSAAEAATALANPEVLACFLRRGGGEEISSAALAQMWEARLAAGLPAFDAAAAIPAAPGGAALAGGEGRPAWPRDILERLPPGLAAEASGPLLCATLHEACALVDAFAAAVGGAARRPAALRLRLACVGHVQCSRLHWDDVPLRGLSALTGAGTEVLPEALVDRAGFVRLAGLPLEHQGAMSPEAWNRRVVRGEDRSSVVRTPPGWALLLKGLQKQGCLHEV